MSFRGNPNVVNLTDNQTISGTKGFNNSLMQYTDYDSQDPSTDNFGVMKVFRDKNGEEIGIQNLEMHNNTLMYHIDARKYVGGVWYGSSVLSANFDLTNNTAYATAPASDIDGSIVTTISKKKAATGYFKLGNGLIVQWGTSSHGTAAITVTFATPFTSTNYAVTAILQTAAASTTERYCPIAYSKTTTNCIIWIKGTDGNISWQATGY